jgi:hypothetical protein
LSKSASAILESAVAEFDPHEVHDIFLSHAKLDEMVVAGARRILRAHGFSVYVDWIEDAQLDRRRVTPETARILRRRMKACRSLLYAASINSSDSRWMPWECGFFDGHKGRCAILPLTDRPQSTFVGIEYMGLYPYVSSSRDTKEIGRLWVESDPKTYVELGEWLEGGVPCPR